MALDRWTRWIHRWVSAIFVACVIAATAAAATGQDTGSPVFYAPLAPLLVLMLSGVYLFVRPWLGRRIPGRE
jgi:heme A synthase